MSSTGSRSGIAAAATSGDPKKLLLGRYELDHLLGRGASAKVYYARDLLTGTAVAIKSFPNPRKASCTNGRSPPAIEKEVSLMRGLKHPNILTLHQVMATRTKIHLVLELAGGGELYKKLKASGRLEEDLSRKYFQQLISAVAYCHSRGVYHRDIKAENLLLDEKDNLKVADFGLGTARSRVHTDGFFHTLCGTPAYVAPEILSKKGYDAGTVDVWSCGVVLFILAAGYLPFNDPNLITMYKRIYRGHFRCPSWFSPELQSLIRQILDPNLMTRIGIQGIIEHPWFRVGLDEKEWTATMSGEDDMEVFKSEFKEEAGRALNAFDIISLSSGCDLSSFFDSVEVRRERFFVTGPAELVSSRVQEIGRKEGLRMRTEEKDVVGPVYLVGQNGKIVAKVEVFRVVDGVSVVEVVNGDGCEAIRLLKKRLEHVFKFPVDDVRSN